jgi:hypothetical protein
MLTGLQIGFGCVVVVSGLMVASLPALFIGMFILFLE